MFTCFDVLCAASDLRTPLIYSNTLPSHLLLKAERNVQTSDCNRHPTRSSPVLSHRQHPYRGKHHLVTQPTATQSDPPAPVLLTQRHSGQSRRSSVSFFVSDNKHPQPKPDLRSPASATSDHTIHHNPRHQGVRSTTTRQYPQYNSTELLQSKLTFDDTTNAYTRQHVL